jgi:hypothetical protein
MLLFEAFIYSGSHIALKLLGGLLRENAILDDIILIYVVGYKNQNNYHPVLRREN